MDGGKALARLKFKMRLDFVAESKSGKLFFGNKGSEDQAEELRQQKVSLLRNIPVQGINIEDINMDHEIYTIIDDYSNRVSYYAPVSILFSADSLENAVKFTMKEEFRTIEMVDPDQIILSQMETVRLIQNVNEELLNFKRVLERRMENWK
jgi:hypothetical protein